MVPPSSEMSARRPRVLLINEYADPTTVSVALVCWSHARAVSKVADTHVVTSIRHRENYVAAGLRDGVDFTSIDNAWEERVVNRTARLFGSGGGLGYSTLTALRIAPYQWFEHQVWNRFEARLEAGEFDLVHRMSPLSPAYPSLIAGRCAAAGIPFVVGPLNGGLPWPEGFGGVRLREREFLGYLRGALRYVPGFRSTRAKASAIVVASRHMRDQIEPEFRHKTVYVPENGIDPSKFGRAAELPATMPLRVAFVGRLVAVKCVDILLEAAAPLVRAKKLVVDVVGDGPELAGLEALAERERLGEGVLFPGWVDHAVLRERLELAHAFAFPSVRDFGGGAVLEAMAMGVPPIVVDYGGPSELVTPRTGFAIPMSPREKLVERFRAVLEQLADRPECLAEVGRRARARAFRYFTWDAKAGQTLEIYRWLMGQRDRPDFGMPFPDDA
jgi:starch synthase